jgi:PAS domain S-box-containing protein
MKHDEFASLFKLSSIAIESYDSSGNLLDVNPACLDLFGFKCKEEVKSFNLFTDRNLPHQAIDEIKAGKSYRYETEINFDLIKKNKPDQTSREGISFMEFYINPTVDENQIVTGYLLHTTEITERHHIADSLFRSEEQYRMLLDLAPDAFFQGDVNGNFITVNKSAIELTGYTREELLKMNMKDLFTEEFLTIKPLKYNLLEQGKVIITEREICQKSGNSIIVEMNSKKMPDGTYQSFFRNITERKKSEIALQQSEEKFRRIIECSTSGMHFYKVGINGSLIFTGANPAADKIIGISHQKLIGKTILEAFPNLSNTEIPALYTSIAKGESGPQEFNIEYNDISISGNYNVQVFQTELNCVSVHFTEISERLNAEKLLEKQSEELGKLNATKDKFLSIIAHDLKNPFNAIIGFSDLMIQSFQELDNDTLLQGLNTIQTASKHAYKLLENLLAWSQNQTGRIAFKPELLNLHTQVSESLKMIESSAKIKGISINLTINKTLKVFADKDMLDSVMRNLILNAIKFSHKEGKIKVSAIEADHVIQVSVKDDGVGIPAEIQSGIFRIDKHTITTGTDNEIGTGLGLILCKDFITRHQGSIWVDSTPGKGSTFTFSLPTNTIEPQ